MRYRSFTVQSTNSSLVKPGLPRHQIRKKSESDSMHQQQLQQQQQQQQRCIIEEIAERGLRRKEPMEVFPERLEMEWSAVVMLVSFNLSSPLSGSGIGTFLNVLGLPEGHRAWSLASFLINNDYSQRITTQR